MNRLDLTAPWTAYRCAAVDVEGNGQQPPDLVELAVVAIVDGKIQTPREWLVKPPRPITSMARRFHKISDADVEDKPATVNVAHEMVTALAGHVLVAHNAHVDLKVIGRELDFAPAYVIDTLKLARRLVPGQISYKLGSLVDAFSLAPGSGEAAEGLVPHRAGYDALMCARLLTHLASSAEDMTLLDLIEDPPATPPEGNGAQALF